MHNVADTLHGGIDSVPFGYQCLIEDAQVWTVTYVESTSVCGSACKSASFELREYEVVLFCLPSGKLGC